MKPSLACWFAAALGATAAWGQVNINLITIPEGLAISVDGSPAQASPRVMSWAVGSTHTIAVASPQGGGGARYVFSGWSDGGPASHSITVPGSAATFTASFTAQYQLNRMASPFISGAVIAIPPSADGYYNSGTVVQLTASPTAGFSFSGYQGDASGTSPSQTVVMSAPRSVTAFFNLIAGVVKTSVPPRLAFRDVWGGIRVNVFGSTSLLPAGGIFGGDPQVVVGADGDAYLVALDTYTSIWINTLRASDLQFTGWRNAGGLIKGIPAIGLSPNGSVYVAVRDQYNAYWLTSYNSVSGLGAWTFLGGNFAADPAMAISSDGAVHLVGKDPWSALWTTTYTPGNSFPGWRSGGGIIQGKPSVSIGTDGVLYVAARDNYQGLWLGRIQNGTWLGWSFGGGIMSIDPKIVTLGDGTVVSVIRDSWGGIWYRPFTEGTSSGWLPWVNAGGKLNAAALAASDGELYIAGANPNGDLCWYRANLNQWTNLGFRGLIAGEVGAGPR